MVNSDAKDAYQSNGTVIPKNESAKMRAVKMSMSTGGMKQEEAKSLLNSANMAFNRVMATAGH